MLMIPARLGRSESFWAVAKVRSPHTGPGIRYIIAPSATRDGLPDPRGLAHRGRGAAQPPCTAQAALCKPRRAVESADAMSTILACETGARSGVRAPCARATG